MSIQDPQSLSRVPRPGGTAPVRGLPRYVTRAENVPELSAQQKAEAARVAERFVFRSNEYYQGLIDWRDPSDPIRRIIMPDVRELNEWGELDASNESAYTVVPGLEHKYADTALLLVNDVCGGYCRFCFRKRLFMDDNDEVVRDVSQGLDYIRAHAEITNVLLTGGDPLILATRKLEPILRELRAIPHVQIIRIGSKIPAFNPFRILEDPILLTTLARYSTARKKIYVMAHFNHPRELTPYAVEALTRLQKAGVVTVNQTPMLHGVNDDVDTLAVLFDKLSFIGVPPYYVFQGRPTEGNENFCVPVERAWRIFERARLRCSGLGRRARFAMSHSTGKIEVLAVCGGKTMFRYHRAARAENRGRMLVFESQPDALWFDDYSEPILDDAV